jgi:hypothetical protein
MATLTMKTAIEVEVTVVGEVDFPIQPHGWDPGDPGGVSLEAVLVRHPTDKTRARVDLLDVLPEAVRKDLEEQLYHQAEEEAEDRYVAAMEAAYDAKKEGE